MFPKWQNPKPQAWGLLSLVHQSGSRPLEDICTSSVAPGSFWHATEGPGFTHQRRGQLRCRSTRGTVKKGDQQGRTPVKTSDGHPCSSCWLAYSFWAPVAIDGARGGRGPGFILLSQRRLEAVSECQQLLTIAHFWCQLPTLHNCSLLVPTYSKRKKSFRSNFIFYV